MRMTVVQTNSMHDKARNIAQATDLITRAIETDRPDVLVLPEVWNWRGGTTAVKLANADRIPGGDAYEALQALARTHKVWIHGGSMIELIPGGSQVYNTTCVFNREGREVARYRKIHMFDITAPDGTPYNESATVKAGSDVVLYDLEGFKVGCTICYDMRFAELYLALAKARRRHHHGAVVVHAADRQGPLGSAAARPRDRDADVHRRARPVRPVRRRRRRDAPLVRPQPHRRPVGPRRLQGFRRHRLRHRQHRARRDYARARPDPSCEP